MLSFVFIESDYLDNSFFKLIDSFIRKKQSDILGKSKEAELKFILF